MRRAGSGGWRPGVGRIEVGGRRWGSGVGGLGQVLGLLGWGQAVGVGRLGSGPVEGLGLGTRVGGRGQGTGVEGLAAGLWLGNWGWTQVQDRWWGSGGWGGGRQQGRGCCGHWGERADRGSGGVGRWGLGLQPAPGALEPPTPPWPQQAHMPPNVSSSQGRVVGTASEGRPVGGAAGSPGKQRQHQKLCTCRSRWVEWFVLLPCWCISTGNPVDLVCVPVSHLVKVTRH